MEKEKYASFRHAKLVELLKVEVNEGRGVGDDPISRVCYFIEPHSGKVLFKNSLEDRLFAGEDEKHPIN